MKIYCVGCLKEVEARLTNGFEIYPHRPDLSTLPFWKCDSCKNYVGCHHKTKDSTRPLGVIPTAELRKARQHIHRILDPLWQKGQYTRQELYAILTHRLGGTKRYHTADVNSLEEARQVYRIVLSLGGKQGRQAKNASR